MKNKFYIILILVYSLLISITAFAQGKVEEIDKLMTYCWENGVFNGTISIAENQEVIYKKAFGLADFVTKERLEPDYDFYLASVSKQFTTISIMILKEEGKLSYDDPLSKYFPQFPPYADQVLIRHLMTHTSGIPDHFRLGANRPGLNNRDVLELLIKQDSLNFQPGEKFSYSNGGYVLLAMITEKVSEMSFHDFMQQNVFGPLGMDRSFVYDESKQNIERRAIGYDMNGEKDDYNIFTTGAGGIYSNVEDLHLWDQALYNNKLVDQETLNEAFQPFKLNNDTLSYYGFGWGISEDGPGNRVSHSGGLAGFRTYLERDLENRNTIILLTNNGNAFVMGGIRSAIRNILDNKEYTLPKIPISITLNKMLKSKEIDEVVSQYHFLKKNREENYDFNENELNNFGYQLLGKNKIKDAIEIFKLNVQTYPDRFNPYDSLGEAYLLDGNEELAIINYKRSLELNPDNTNAEKVLNQIGGEKTSKAK